MSKILSSGDATLDAFLQIHDADIHCKLDRGSCELCFQYADKILVDKLDFLIGGNAANTAVSFARLGHDSAYFGYTGDDDTGRKIKATLDQNKVDTRFLFFEKGTRANYSTVIDFQKERTILVYHEPHHYIIPANLELPEWLYLTSTGHGWEKIYQEILSKLSVDKTKLAFNPGTYQFKAPVDVLHPVFAKTYTLFVNKEEAQLLVNNNREGDIKMLQDKLYQLGPRIVVITDGPKGSYSYDGRHRLFMPILDAPVVERTGAGDSFSSAFCAALMYDKTIEKAMVWGTYNAASVIGQIGPQVGLLTYKQMQEKLKSPEISAKEI